MAFVEANLQHCTSVIFVAFGPIHGPTVSSKEFFCNTASSTRLFFVFLVQVTGFPGSFEHFSTAAASTFRGLRHTILLGHLLQEFLMLGQSFLGKHQLVLFCL